MYSALKRDGRPLYSYARAGETVERAVRPVTIHALEMVAFEAPDRARLQVRCSKGTYIRSLAADLGTRLGVGAHLVELRRTASGPFRLDQSITLDALAAGGSKETSDAYRTRQNFQPTATISLAKPLTLEVGVSFERFQDQFPAAHTEAANALVTTLRYHQRLAESEFQQDVDADYTLRAASRSLGSDFVYASHLVGLHYRVAHGKHQLMEQFVAGSVSGRAPLSDRFVAGNSYYLRGWNKYEIDPIGGNRLVHNTVEYRYGAFQAFYDAGAVWDSGQQATLRNSVGAGFKKSLFSLAVAFPVRSGHIEPILMIGMIY